MPEWMVRLVGPERDLRFLLGTLRRPECRVTEDDDGFYLRSRRFDGLDGAGEVSRLADEIVHQANLVALLHCERSEGNVRTGEVVRVDPDGSRHVTISATLRAAGRATVTFVGSPPAPPPDLSRGMAAIDRRPLLKKAIGHVRDEPRWSGYWKAAEALGEEIGGLDRVHELYGWASKYQFERFCDTAHHHRHHRKPAPPNPMSEAEGRAFIVGLLRRCLEWNLAGRPKPA